ncbi:MAG: hypothetical protein CME32_11400 [Gimesia sp.]|nr:hypothetical protein [Gimesia sp.]
MIFILKTLLCHFIALVFTLVYLRSICRLTGDCLALPETVRDDFVIPGSEAWLSAADSAELS